ncbi:MAG: FAD-dependent oxidoreductase [Lachnospiraceae bacterium]|nr:FAD-dependent oxidoreductase [Lachnospiraceae bacterium]
MNYYDYCYDIAVFGAGPAGLAAAVTAARQGKKVILLEKNGYLGGNLATGLPPLSVLDEHGNQCIAGFCEEILKRLEKNGHCYGTRVCPKHNSISNLHADYLKVLAIEMCQEAGVDILLHCEACEAEVVNGAVKQVKLYGKCNEIMVKAGVYIDCTGDGDVAYLAGCSYEKGQPGTGVLQPPTVMFTLENVDHARLFDYIEEHPEEVKFSKTIDQKPGYDAAYFKASPNHIFVGMTVLFERLKKEGKLPVNRESMICINGLNPGEVYINSTRLLNVDATDIRDLTRAELEGQTQIPKLIEVFRRYVPGFENCWLAAICPNLGVRETRRFTGIRRIVAEDAIAGLVPDDSIALSGYKMDIHNGTNCTTVFQTIDKPFGVPYGCLVSSERSNLMFAGRCASTDARVIGSTRVMSVCMAMGQAAGVGAALAVDQSRAPRDVDIQEIRGILRQQGAILSMEK